MSDRDAILARIKAEVDALLERGETPDPAQWFDLLPDGQEEVETLVELRVFSHQHRSETDQDESLLAEIQAEIQDARNRGERPDLVGYEARHPHLAHRLEALAGMQDFIRDALTGEYWAGSPRFPGDDAQSALGRYRVLRRLADHPAGTAYLAVGGEPPERVELLVLSPDVPRDLAWEVMREVDQTRSLVGEGFLRAREVGEVRGVRYVVFEHREGVTLGQVLFDLAFHGGERTLVGVMPPRGAPVADEESEDDLFEAQRQLESAARDLAKNSVHVVASLRLMARLARIVARAHLQGRLHKSLIPGALVLDGEGSLFVRWFGMGSSRFRPRGGARPTRIWRAPELVLPGHARVDWRADVWGVGALLLALLVFDSPLERSSDSDADARLGRDGPDRVRRLIESAPAPLQGVLSGTLAWSPKERIPNCDVLAEELTALATSLKSPPRPTPETAPPRRRWPFGRKT